MITRQAIKLNWEGTNRILQAAVQKANELGIPMSIAVVDDGTHLLGFARTDQGKPHTIRIAEVKARAAASNRLPTGKISSTGQEVNDHRAIALPLAALPLAIVLVRRVYAAAGRELNRCLAMAGALQWLFGILFVAGTLIR